MPLKVKGCSSTLMEDESFLLEVSVFSVWHIQSQALGHSNRMPMITKAESVKPVTVVKSFMAYSITKGKKALVHHRGMQIQGFLYYQETLLGQT